MTQFHSTCNPFVDLRPDTELGLPESDHFTAAGHWWSQPEIDALILAYAARRPLLVRGEAGSGKSQIDKADADVPNALLDVLGNRSFTVPPLGYRIVRAPGGRLPLIILTTNEERELPAAFVRRCVVLNVNPPAHETPEGEAAFVDWLVTRGRVHRHLDIADEARALAAQQVLADRKVAIGFGYPKVGLAEYIDLLTALHELTQATPGEQRAAEQIHWLQRLGAYALVKNADQPQDRAPVAPPPASPDPNQPST